MEFFDPLDAMFAIGLDLPCKRIPAVEPEMRDRDDMHRPGVAKTEIEGTHDAALVAHVSNLGDTTLVRKNPLRPFLQGSPQPDLRDRAHGQCSPHSLHQRQRSFHVIDHRSSLPLFRHHGIHQPVGDSGSINGLDKPDVRAVGERSVKRRQCRRDIFHGVKGHGDCRAGRHVKGVGPG